MPKKDEQAKTEPPKSESTEDAMQSFVEFMTAQITANLPPDKRTKYNVMFEVFDEMFHDDRIVFILAMKAYQTKLQDEHRAAHSKGN